MDVESAKNLLYRGAESAVDFAADAMPGVSGVLAAGVQGAMNTRGYQEKQEKKQLTKLANEASKLELQRQIRNASLDDSTAALKAQTENYQARMARDSAYQKMYNENYERISDGIYKGLELNGYLQSLNAQEREEVKNSAAYKRYAEFMSLGEYLGRAVQGDNDAVGFLENRVNVMGGTIGGINMNPRDPAGPSANVIFGDKDYTINANNMLAGSNLTQQDLMKYIQTKCTMCKAFTENNATASAYTSAANAGAVKTKSDPVEMMGYLQKIAANATEEQKWVFAVRQILGQYKNDPSPETNTGLINRISQLTMMPANAANEQSVLQNLGFKVDPKTRQIFYGDKLVSMDELDKMLAPRDSIGKAFDVKCQQINEEKDSAALLESRRMEIQNLKDLADIEGKKLDNEKKRQELGIGEDGKGTASNDPDRGFTDVEYVEYINMFPNGLAAFKKIKPSQARKAMEIYRASDAIAEQLGLGSIGGNDKSFISNIDFTQLVDETTGRSTDYAEDVMNKLRSVIAFEETSFEENEITQKGITEESRAQRLLNQIKSELGKGEDRKMHRDQDEAAKKFDAYRANMRADESKKPTRPYNPYLR